MSLTKKTLVLLIAAVAVLLLGMDACDGVASVTINEGDTTLVVGETRALTVTVITRGGADRAVRWSSSDPDVATVNQTGSVTGHSEGVARISVVSLADPAKQDAITATVTASEVTPSAEVRTCKSIYGLFEGVLVTFSGFPGDRQEWITIVPATARDDEVGEGFFTDGAHAGEITFHGFPPGDHEVRAYFDWPDDGFVVQDRHGFEVVGTTDDGWMDPDVLDRAWNDLLDGATEVQLTADGRMTYRFEHAAEDTLREELRRDDHVFAWWESTGYAAEAAFDVNFDGRYDEEIAATYEAEDQWEKITTSWTTAPERTITERRTLRRDGESLHVIVERPDETGELEVVEAFVIPMVQPIAVSGSRIRHGETSTCSQAERDRLAELWKPAMSRGLVCLATHGQYGDFAKLLRRFLRRPVEFICQETPNEDSPEAIAWVFTHDFWYWEHVMAQIHAWTIPIHINRPEFFSPKYSDHDRAGALFHESLHLTMGPHNPELEGRSPTWEARARHDRVYACQLLCFGGPENRLAFCEACTVSGSYGRHGECNDACDRYVTGDDPWYCPCAANWTDYGWHDSATACAVKCPRGLACFNALCQPRDMRCKR